MTDPYSVLGITPSADDETIKKAYRKKCKEYHPDLHPDDPSAEEHFKEVQAAYSEIMRIKQGGGALMQVKSGASLSDVVKAINALGAAPQDLLSILQAMKAAGALKADLEII